MSEPQPLSKAERLAEFFRRLRAAPLPANHDEAMQLLADTMNAVEDELSGIPYDPANAGNDGRMYPPDERYRRADERPGVRCYYQLHHKTLVAENGAIEVRQRPRPGTAEQVESAVCTKQGSDGREVADYEPDS